MISAAFVFVPYPRPSATPAAIAMTFFNAPPISQPTTSSLVYTRNAWVMSSCLHQLALPPRSGNATHVAAGCPAMISLARFGPLSTPIVDGSRRGIDVGEHLAHPHARALFETLRDVEDERGGDIDRLDERAQVLRRDREDDEVGAVQSRRGGRS